MPIQVGDTLPKAHFFILGDDGPQQISSEEVFKGKTVVLFAVPGAFTSTCHRHHLPGYLEHSDTIKAKGADSIAVVAVNDPFVMAAWAKHTGAKGKIQFLADSHGLFTKAIDMEFDGSPAGLGVRSKRYSMIVKDSVVTALNLEDVPSQVTISGAAAILNQL